MKPQVRTWLATVWGTYWRRQGGAAAAEFALVLLFLVVPVLNVVDFGTYVFDRMELDNAAQITVQTAWEKCALTGYVPATVNNYCAGLTGAITTAAHSTSMGSSVSVSSTAEDYCCPGSTTLDCSKGSVASYTTSPVSACPSGEGGNAPGDYIFVTVSYSYSPLFPSVSVASLLTTPITRTAYMRLS
jgi:Flp pilus assembly protein TadG